MKKTEIQEITEGEACYEQLQDIIRRKGTGRKYWEGLSGGWVVQRLEGGDVGNLSRFWEETARKKTLPGTYLTPPPGEMS